MQNARLKLSAAVLVAINATMHLSMPAPAFGQQRPTVPAYPATKIPTAAPLPAGLVRPAAYDDEASGEQHPQAAPPAAPRPAAAEAEAERFTQVAFRLKNIRAAELEYHLLRMGVRPETSGDVPSERYLSFRWKSASNRPSIGIRLDRKSNAVELEGTESTVRVWRNLVMLIDAPADGGMTQVIPLVKAEPDRVRQLVTLAKTAARNAAATAAPLPPRAGNNTPATQVGLFQPAAEAPAAPPAANPAADGEEGEGGLLGTIQVEVIEGLDGLILRGKKRDVERVQRLIEELERQSIDTQPDLEIVPMKHVDNRSLAELLVQIYDQVFAGRQGRITILPLIKPNAVLLIGRKENIETVRGLIAKLDQPTPPQSQLKIFPLKNISAVNAEQTVRNFFVNRPGFGTDERPGLGARVNVIADTQSNSLIVQAAPRDMLEVTNLLKTLDAETNASKQEVRIFKLRNTLADEMAPVLQRAISGQGGSATPGIPGLQGQQGGAQQTPAGQTGARRTTSLQFLEIDGQQSRVVESGILNDTSIVSDPRSNSLVVTGPSRGMQLIEALIRRLDELPATEAQIKVFTIVNGDATTLSTLLQQLFGQATQGGGQGGFNQFGAGLNLQTAGGDGTLVPLRFSVDTRTNSIVASGSPGDLRVVNQILIRLDEGNIRDRVTTVYRLQNAPAFDVSQAINQWLQGRRQINQLETQITSPFEQIEREVIVVPEIVSNSLIVSATPRYFEEVKKIVVDLDRRPPMVVIQVLIAEVQLNNTDELGVELGLQDSLLFDRGIGAPGFLFNNQPLGNQTTAQALATRENTAGQALSHFALSRTNSDLGYGGLVLSASSESVSVLIRALQESRRLQVISRPQVQTLDNQPAFVQVGARVPRITSSQLTTNGTINNTVLENVGILLGVTPRTSPDGLIVMEINAEKSELGPEAEGIPISINNAGDVIRSPQIKITTAQTTVSARSGQTVILGGLITTNRSEVTRRVPYLADIPLLGRLFRYDRIDQSRRELLIIMTPFVMRTDEDIEWMNQRESERLSWCLADIANIHGEVSFATAGGPWNKEASPLILPDGSVPLETLPGPSILPSTANPPPTTTQNPGQSTNSRPRTETLPPAAETPSIEPLPPQQPLRRPPTDGGASYLPPSLDLNPPASAGPKAPNDGLTPALVVPAATPNVAPAAYWAPAQPPAGPPPAPRYVPSAAAAPKNAPQAAARRAGYSVPVQPVSRTR